MDTGGEWDWWVERVKEGGKLTEPGGYISCELSRGKDAAEGVMVNSLISHSNAKVEQIAKQLAPVALVSRD